MAGDGVKTDRRAKSTRNKIVSVLTAVTGIAVTAEQMAPGIVPPGAGVMAGQLSALATLLVNQFWPK